MTTPVKTLLAVLGFLLGVCLWFFPVKPLEGQTFGLFALALLLEMSAVHLPTLGFISASFPIFFVLGFLPFCGPSTALLCLLVVLFLRSVLRPGSDSKIVFLEFLLDATSIAAATVVGGLLREVEIYKIDDFPVSILAILGAILTYGFLQTKLYANALAHLKISKDLYLAQTEAVALQARAAAMSAPALLLLVLEGPWHILWTLPVFLAFYQSNWENLSELSKARAEKTVAKVKNVRKDQVLLKAAKNLAGLQSQKRLVQKCSAAFAKTRSSQESFVALTKILDSFVRLQFVAVALSRDRKLEPLFCRGPGADEFFQQPQAGRFEPLITKAWSSGEIQRSNDTDLAFPLHGVGVLYLGSASEQLGGETFQNLSIVAYQFSLSLQSTLREEALVKTLEQVKDANRQIALGRERLLRLLQGSHKMTRKLEAEHILGEATQTLLELFRPDFLVIRAYDWGELLEGMKPPQAMLDQAVAVLTQGDDSYSLQKFESDTGPVLFMGHRLSWEGRSLGFLLMAAQEQDHFSRAQRRFLELLALHCSVMLTNSTLFSDVTRARKDLVESQAQLVQSSKLAAVGQLAAGVAHELNTPLGAVLLSIQSASRQLRKGRYEKANDRLEDAVKGADIAKEIVNKLLFYSREGREDGVQVSLTQIVNDTVGFLGSQLTNDNIELHTNIEDECWVEGNQNELQQILTNLLVNARDAIAEASPGLGRIDIRVVLMDGQAKLSVSDNGPGFTEEAQNKAFDPFFTTKPIGSGTGLGLHVSRQIAERHLGELLLHSVSGEGATVTLVLPSIKSGRERLS